MLPLGIGLLGRPDEGEIAPDRTAGARGPGRQLLEGTQLILPAAQPARRRPAQPRYPSWKLAGRGQRREGMCARSLRRAAAAAAVRTQIRGFGRALQSVWSRSREATSRGSAGVRRRQESRGHTGCQGCGRTPVRTWPARRSH